jgi:hypothetical protein
MKIKILIAIIALAALILMALPVAGQLEGVSNANGLHLSQSSFGTATPQLMVNQGGSAPNNIFELRDASTPILQIDADGNTFRGVTAYTLTGAQTLTPAGTVYTVAPSAVLTLTLGTGASGQELMIFNIVATTTTIVDTGATQGGGNVTLGQDDMAHFIYIDGVWIEISSPDNS